MVCGSRHGAPCGWPRADRLYPTGGGLLLGRTGFVVGRIARLAADHCSTTRWGRLCTDHRGGVAVCRSVEHCARGGAWAGPDGAPSAGCERRNGGPGVCFSVVVGGVAAGVCGAIFAAVGHAWFCGRRGFVDGGGPGPCGFWCGCGGWVGCSHALARVGGAGCGGVGLGAAPALATNARFADGSCCRRIGGGGCRDVGQGAWRGICARCGAEHVCVAAAARLERYPLGCLGAPTRRAAGGARAADGAGQQSGDFGVQPRAGAGPRPAGPTPTVRCAAKACWAHCVAWRE